MTLERVISGAQIGADIAGLRAAMGVGLETGGWMPRGWRTKAGPLPLRQAELYSLRCTADASYRQRTEYNIRDSDATVTFAHDPRSAGTDLTRRICEVMERPRFHVMLTRPENTQDGPVWLATPNYERFVEWLRLAEIRTLNVAGNADSSIEVVVECYLTAAFLNLRRT